MGTSTTNLGNPTTHEATPSRLKALVSCEWLALVVIVVLGLALRLHDLDAVTLVGDEVQDLPIAVQHWHNPYPLDVPDKLDDADPSQARLPYFITGLGIYVLVSRVRTWVVLGGFIALATLLFLIRRPQPWGRWSALTPIAAVGVLCFILGPPAPPLEVLVAGRVVAALFGALGIVACYLLAKDLAGYEAGLFGAGTLAVSTIHIAGSRYALTTGDIFVTTFLTFAVWLLRRAVRTRSGRTAIAAGIATGLTLASKLSGILLWPTAVVYTLVLSFLPNTRRLRAVSPLDARRAWTAVVAHVALLPPLALVFFWPRLFGPEADSGRLAVWLLCLALCASAYAWLLLRAWSVPRRLIWLVTANVLLGGAVVAAFATPYHLRVEVFDGLQTWWESWGTAETIEARPFRDWVDGLKVLMIRTGLPVNVLAVIGVGLILSPQRFRRGGLCLLTIAVYSVGVALVHHKATHYLLPMIPLLHALSGYGLVVVVKSYMRQETWAKTGILALAGLVIVLNLAWAWHIRPYYGVDGVWWQKRFAFNGPLQPAGVYNQPLRPALRWVVENRPDAAQVALAVLPNTPTGRCLHLTRILRYELVHMKADGTNPPDVAVVRDPRNLRRYDTIVVLRRHRKLVPHLASANLAREIRLNGLPAAWIFVQTKGPPLRSGHRPLDQPD